MLGPLRLYDLLAQMQKFKKHFKVRLNSEPRMVGLVQSALERGVYPETSPGEMSGHAPLAGCVGLMGMWSHLWFQVVWDLLTIASTSITPKEIFPILVAGAIWGRQWKGAMVCAHCDNAAVVEIINSGRAKDPLLAHQISRSRRCILRARRTVRLAPSPAITSTPPSPRLPQPLDSLKTDPFRLGVTICLGRTGRGIFARWRLSSATSLGKACLLACSSAMRMGSHSPAPRL